MPDVFISHSSKNDDIITRLHDALTAATGVQIWVDHLKLGAGVDWQVEVDNALAASSFCLVVVSQDSIASGEVRGEWRKALALNLPLLPVLIEDVAFGEIPYRFFNIQWVILKSADQWNSAVDQLSKAIKGDVVLTRPDIELNATLSVEIATELANFTPQKSKDIVSFIALLGAIGVDKIRIIDTKTGSVILTLELPLSAASKVIENYKNDSDKLNELQITDIRLLDVELHQSTDTVQFTRWPLTGRVDPRLAAIPLRGRDDELRDVLDKLKRGVTLIVGVGGLGKSRLAAEAALTMPDIQGAVWQSASDVSRPDEVIELLRDHFGLPVTADRREVLARVKTSPLLVIIDNAEDIKENDPRRGDYIRLIEDLRAQGAPVLLTSRVEWDDLRGAQIVSPNRLDADAAAQIVLDMAAAIGVEHDLTAQAAEIAQKSFYHPRLIEWAVGGMRRFPPDKILRDLADLKSKRAQDALDEMILKTLRDLTAAEGDLPERILRRLNVCRGGFTYDAALQIGKLDDISDDDFDSAFVHLQSWRFVAGRDKRYTIDPIVIAAVPEDPAAHRPHYTYYKALAKQHRDKQDYLGFDPDSDNLEAAFEWAMAAAEYADVYWLYNVSANFLENRGRFDQNKTWLEQVAANLIDYSDEYLKAAVQNSLGLMFWQHPTGDRAANLKRSIAAYEAALVYSTPGNAPLSYAMTQNNLGNVYSDLAAIEDREANLRRAITAYEAALVYWTPQAAPLDYAMTQNNLGTAYADLAALEDRQSNLRRAVAAYEAALVYRTPQAASLDYAGTQNNLGIAYSDLSEIEDREANLRRAITAYEAALLYRTPQAASLHYAETQNNLGTAYADLAALEEREANLRRAITAYEAALVYITPQAAPLAYAMTQANLGLVYRDLRDKMRAAACWHVAENIFRQMGTIEYADRVAGWLRSLDADEE